MIKLGNKQSIRKGIGCRIGWYTIMKIAQEFRRITNE